MIEGDLLRLSLEIANGRDLQPKPKRKQVVVTQLRRKHRMNRRELQDYAMQPLKDLEQGSGMNERDFALLELGRELTRECMRQKLLPTDTRWMEGKNP